jgi:hypothetical protein
MLFIAYDHDVTGKWIAKEWTKSKKEHGDHEKRVKKPKNSTQEWWHKTNPF